MFEGLLSDEIWGVRKACAETIAEFSEALPAPFRTNTLTTWFIRLADDQSRWVCPIVASCHPPLTKYLGSELGVQVAWPADCHVRTTGTA